MNIFIKASINTSTIYIKIEKELMGALFDILHDESYVITNCTPAEWDYHIEYGLSYEVDTEEEIMEFKYINNKAKDINNET